MFVSSWYSQSSVSSYSRVNDSLFCALTIIGLLKFLSSVEFENSWILVFLFTLVKFTVNCRCSLFWVFIVLKVFRFSCPCGFLSGFI